VEKCPFTNLKIFGQVPFKQGVRSWAVSFILFLFELLELTKPFVCSLVGFSVKPCPQTWSTWREKSHIYVSARSFVVFCYTCNFFSHYIY